ncbi:MAG: hypothetical protein ACLTC8_06005 [Lachnospiraceae bacterium]
MQVKIADSGKLYLSISVPAAQELELYEKSFAYFANALKAGEELGIETMAN